MLKGQIREAQDAEYMDTEQMKSYYTTYYQRMSLRKQKVHWNLHTRRENKN